MTPYILVGAFLWLVTLFTMRREENVGPSLLCLIVLILFTGLRYEIGYDWLAYEQYYIWARPSLSASAYADGQMVLPVEYLYFILNATFKKFGASFEALIFFISAFNLIIIDRMARVIAPSSRPFLWLMYFCLALIMVQFNILRQSIASSFVILFLLTACKKDYFRSVPLGLISLGFHTSTAMFAPILPFIHRPINKKYVIILLFISFAIFAVGNVFLAGALNAIGSILPGDISAKTDVYATGIAGGNVWGISPLAAVLIFFYIFILFKFMALPSNPYINVAILLTIAVLIAHVAFGQVPIIWNRVMCVSLPWQLAVLWKYYIKEFSADKRFIGVAGGGIAALGVFSFQLSQPENIAFVPYHSLTQVWLFDDNGDGRVRSMYAVQQGQIEASQRARQ